MVEVFEQCVIVFFYVFVYFFLLVWVGFCYIDGDEVIVVFGVDFFGCCWVGEKIEGEFMFGIFSVVGDWQV